MHSETTSTLCYMHSFNVTVLHYSMFSIHGEIVSKKVGNNFLYITRSINQQTIIMLSLLGYKYYNCSNQSCYTVFFLH